MLLFRKYRFLCYQRFVVLVLAYSHRITKDAVVYYSRNTNVVQSTWRLKRISCRYCVNYCLDYTRIDVAYYHIHFLILLALILCDLILCGLLFLHLPVTQTCLSFIFVLNLCRMIIFLLRLVLSL